MFLSCITYDQRVIHFRTHTPLKVQNFDLTRLRISIIPLKGACAARAVNSIFKNVEFLQFYANFYASFASTRWEIQL